MNIEKRGSIVNPVVCISIKSIMSQPLSPQEPIPNRLQGLVALVTGAAGNIGLASARRYLLEGSKVVLVDIDADKLVQSKAALTDAITESSDGNQFSPDDVILTVRANVTAEEDVQRYVDEAIQKFGRLDIALLCAGISYSSTSILETDVSQYDKVMQVNCRSGKCSQNIQSTANQPLTPILWILQPF